LRQLLFNATIILVYSTWDNVNKSLRLAWRFKILWIFALLLAAGSGFNGSGGSGGSSDTSKVTPVNQINEERSVDLNTLQNSVLGAATSADPFAHFNFAQYLPQTILVILDILLLCVFSLVMCVVISNWAEGAFLTGVHDAIENKDLSLRRLADVGRSRVVPLILLKLRFLLLSFLIGMGVAVIIILAVVFTKSNPLVVLLVLPLFLVFIGVVLYFTFGLIFAVRYVVIENKDFRESIELGLLAFKKNIGNSIKLVLANCLVQMGFIVAAVVIAALLIGIAALLISVTMHNLSGAALVIYIILGDYIPVAVIALVLGFTVLGGYMNTYKGFTWSILFDFLRRENEDKVL
jgi:hypothetical protein